MAADHVIDGVEYRFPRTRAECLDGPRPCPWVRCRYHLFGEVLPRKYRVNKAFAHLSDPSEMPPDLSCALDVADRGGLTLQETGNIFGLTRERIRQIVACENCSDLRYRDHRVAARRAAFVGIRDLAARNLDLSDYCYSAHAAISWDEV